MPIFWLNYQELGQLIRSDLLLSGFCWREKRLFIAKGKMEDFKRSYL